MLIRIKKISREAEEYVEIGYHEHESYVDDIVNFIKKLSGSVEAQKDGKQYEIPISDIYYIESVDNHTFIYLAKDNYDTNRKLYEFEELLQGRNFIRISKSMILNVMKVENIKPALNGRFQCQLTNGESVIISRKYVADFKEFIGRRV